MTRATDASIARAFDRALLNFDVATPWSVVYRRMKEWAAEFDAESPAGTTDEICDCGYVRGSFGCDNAHKRAMKECASVKRVQTPTEPDRGYCPLCRGNVWVGRSCNGPNCPLRPA